MFKLKTLDNEGLGDTLALCVALAVVQYYYSLDLVTLVAHFQACYPEILHSSNIG